MRLPIRSSTNSAPVAPAFDELNSVCCAATGRDPGVVLRGMGRAPQRLPLSSFLPEWAAAARDVDALGCRPSHSRFRPVTTRPGPACFASSTSMRRARSSSRWVGRPTRGGCTRSWSRACRCRGPRWSSAGCPVTTTAAELVGAAVGCAGPGGRPSLDVRAAGDKEQVEVLRLRVRPLRWPAGSLPDPARRRQAGHGARRRARGVKRRARGRPAEAHCPLDASQAAREPGVRAGRGGGGVVVRGGERVVPRDRGGGAAQRSG